LRALGQGRAAGGLSIFGVIAGTFVHLGLALRIALPGNS
jgi:threonine/homoserine/homoserine lactone efflux protein